MSEYAFTPKACKGDPESPAAFAGTITLRLPTWDEMCDSSEKMLLIPKHDDDNVMMLRRARALVKISEPFYVKVDITRATDGKKYDSFAAMSVDKSCFPILAEVGAQIVSGTDQGNG